MFLNELRKESLLRTLQFLSFFLFNPNPSFTPPSFNNPAISSWVGETWHCGGGGRGWRSCKPLWAFVKLLKFWKFPCEIRHLSNNVNTNKVTASLVTWYNISNNEPIRCCVVSGHLSWDCKRMLLQRGSQSQVFNNCKDTVDMPQLLTHNHHSIHIKKISLFFIFYMWRNQC